MLLMARAGYHPDFVPALHHLLHARTDDGERSSPYSMHPSWQERDRELSQAYVESSIEFEHLWTDWHASPGGNPPVVVFAEHPILSRTRAKEWQVSLPLRCQNLAGAVEVVLEGEPGWRAGFRDGTPSFQSESELRQITGCTSSKTTVTFSLGNSESAGTDSLRPTDICVLDAWGSVLARVDVPDLNRRNRAQHPPSVPARRCQ